LRFSGSFFTLLSLPRNFFYNDSENHSKIRRLSLCPTPALYAALHSSAPSVTWVCQVRSHFDSELLFARRGFRDVLWANRWKHLGEKEDLTGILKEKL
jgi:hypothetical protein